MEHLLATERRNPRTADIDIADTPEVLAFLNDEDARVPMAVRAILPQLAEVVDAAVERFASGASIHYFGAGASGRIGALDAAELPPTFSVPEERVVAHIAGGSHAILHSREEFEDDFDLGANDAAAADENDIVFGLTASGTTPYVVGAVTAAHQIGALCAVVSSNNNPDLRSLCDHYLHVDTGPEPLTGSTRMKAATAQKLVLNSFSTALMARLGMTYSNLMVAVTPSNTKLRDRAVRLLMEASGRAEEECRTHLDHSGGRVKVALLMLMGAESRTDALKALDHAKGRAREAIQYLNDGISPDIT